MVAVRVDVGVAVADPDRAEAGPEPVVTSVGPDEFCRRMHPKLAGALRLYLGEPDVAAELAQEALVRAIERWPQVSAMERPDAWAYRVAFNLARSQLRRRLAERRATIRSGPAPTSSWNVDVAEVLAVRSAVAALPPRQRQAVVLRYFGDLSTGDTALAMGCRPGTVKAHLHQALAALRHAGLRPEPEPDPVPTDPAPAPALEARP